MKKVLSLVLALVLVLGSFSFVSAAPLSDVAGTEFEAAVERLSQLGVLTGYPDGTFKPANSITRAEFAAAVIRVKGYEAIANATKGLSTGFSDVPATHWASGYVGTAAKLGLVNGMGDGTFAPEAPVTYEQAVTMVIRALGYEPAALAKGGYPYGYLIVANENGLLDTVKGTQGLPASRGIVAKLLDNSLEIKLMVQTGFGTSTRWVVSGTEGTDVKYLLDELGFSSVTGVVSAPNVKKSTVKVGAETLTVPAGFDYNFYEGLTIKAWYSGSKIAAYAATNAAKYDAVEVDGSKLYLVSEEKSYELVDTLTPENADYAKVVLNKDGKVAFVKYYNFEFIVVDRVKEDIVYDIRNDEVDLEDYTVLKDGKTISVADIEEGDVLFFDYAKDFALVYNNSVEGKIDRVYDDGFKLGTKVYDLAADALFLDGKTLATLSEKVLDEMMAEDKAVEVFFNHAGDVVLVVGSRGVVPVTTTSQYAFLTAVTKQFEGTGRNEGKFYWTFDIFNQEGASVTYDLTDNFVKNLKANGDAVAVGSETFVGAAEWNTTTMAKGTPVKVTLDKDGKVTKVEKLATVDASAFKLSATYVDGYRLQSSTLIFYVDGAGKNKVVKLGDAKDFTKVEAGADLVEVNGRVAAVFAAVTDVDAEDPDYHTGLVTRLRKLYSGVYEFTFADGTVKLTTSDKLSLVADDIVNYLVKVELDAKSGKINAHTVLVPVEGVVKSRSTTANTVTIEAGERVFELNANAVLYNIDENDNVTVIKLRDLVAGDEIEVYLDGASARFVNYVIRVEAR